MERTSVGSLLRTTQAFCQQICEKQTLDFGIAFYSTRFPSLPDANQFREVMLNDAAKIPAAFEQVEWLFASKGLKCLRWSPAIDVDTDALESFLLGHGFDARESIVFRLEEWRSLDASTEFRVLPARAMRSALVDTFVQASTPSDTVERQLQAESFLERLDDPQLDMFVALADKRPVGRCGLYQVGDIARVLDLVVVPSYEGRGVDRTLLAHVLALARRLTMPLVLAQAAALDEVRKALMMEAGFRPDNQIVEFESPTSFSKVPPV